MGDHPTDNKKLAEHFVTQFTHLLKGVHLYPPGHSMLRMIIEKFFQELTTMLPAAGKLRLRIFENKLLVQDTPVANEPTLLAEMQKRYIRQIIFHEHVALPDVNALIDVLIADEEKLLDMGGARRLFDQNSGSHIDLIEYYTLTGAGFEQDEFSQWTNSDVFAFLLDEHRDSLEPEPARQLYTVLKNPYLTAALLKAAAEHLRTANPGAPPEHSILAALLHKILRVLDTHEFSEPAELQTILRDIISGFERRDFFKLLFFHSDDPALTEKGLSVQQLSERIPPGELAELIAEQTADGPPDNILAHTKKVLSRLFLQRQQLLSFLPLLKTTLKEALAAGGDRAFNEICSVFSVGFSLEQDTELSLGGISAAEQQDIADGLNVLKTVPIDKSGINTLLRNYDVENAYSYILQELLHPSTTPEIFQNSLNALLERLKQVLDKDNFKRSEEIFSKLGTLVRPDSPLPGELSKRIINAPNKLPHRLLEKYIVYVLSETPETSLPRELEKINLLLTDHFSGILLKFYIRQETIPQKTLLETIICKQYRSALLSFSDDLRSEPETNILRLLELFKLLPVEAVLPRLWEITYHQDRQTAQLALSRIAELNMPSVVGYLLQAITHPCQILRLIAVEKLAEFNYPDVASRLTLLARGTDPGITPDNRLQMRLTALQSLQKINTETFYSLLKELIGKRTFLFFPAEDKTILKFCKARLRNKAHPA